MHSRFRLPVPLPLEGATANVTFNSSLAHLFRETSLIIWDEAPNAPKAAFAAVDACLRDILDKAEKPFGGMPMLLGGDFRQIPPVLPRVEVDAIASFTLRCCPFWGDSAHFRHYPLTQNKRAEGDALYATFLQQIGDGTYTGASSAVPLEQDELGAAVSPACIQLRSSLLLPVDANADTLIEWVYPADDFSKHAAQSVELGRTIRERKKIYSLLKKICLLLKMTKFVQQS